MRSFLDGKTLEAVQNVPGEIRTAGSSAVLNANSLPNLSVRVNWKARTDISLQAHIKNARGAIAELLEREQRAEQTKAHQEALGWLARNREKYVGQWIAVRGAELLATGTNARDVYAQVRGVKPSALILKIEREDLPFAGW